MLYLNDLNEEQQKAVTCVEGPLLVLAGAGSGKTRVLTYRLAYIAEKLSTRNILAVTFTNKAAGEMTKRVGKILGPRAEGLWVSTFHAFGNRILRAEIGALGRNPDFVILDEQDQIGLIKLCLKELNMDTSTWPPRYIKWHIETAKAAQLSPSDMAARSVAFKEAGATKVYRHYENRLVETGSLDFNDLILLTLRLFRERPEIREKYACKFRFIMVDEFQDTNRIQYDLIRALVGPEQNICVVGDEDQSIYRWRGADIRNILGFQSDFPSAKLIRLEKNYRSVSTILEAASAVIAHNTSRIGKKLVSIRGGGENIAQYVAANEIDEARYVAGKVKEILSTRYSHNNIAVFYRTHAQSRSVEEALLAAEIPYIIVGGVRFYDRKEIKDTLAYLRLAINPNDDISFLRIINVPPRNIGKATLDKLGQSAASKKMPLLRACRSEAHGVKTTKQEALKQFARMVESIAAEIPASGVMEIIDKCLEITGYRNWLKNMPGIEALGRLENLNELLTAAEEYEESEPETSITGFLDNASLLSNLDTAPEAHGAVTLMTLHTAKGLEFPVVFLIGLEDGIFPHVLSRGDPEAMEEERRLCYVGMTRAKDLLFMTRTAARKMHGTEIVNPPSPYLDEIPPRLMRVEGYVMNRPQTDADSTYQSGIHYDETEIGLRPGRRVKHPQFGAGIVEAVEGQGENTKVRVYFHSCGRKTLMLKFAQLEPA